MCLSFLEVVSGEELLPVVFSAPMEKLQEAYSRIEVFCAKRYKESAAEPQAKRQKR